MTFAPLKNIDLTSQLLICSDRLRLGDCINEGKFGKIYKAILVTNFTYQTVAVKEYKQDDSQQRRLLFEKAKRLCQFHHLNIVNLLGMVWKEKSLMIVFEYAGDFTLLQYLDEKGILLGFLKHQKFAVECAAGMQYLESKKMVHCNLDARNVLLNEETLSCKIADFGFTTILDKDHTFAQNDELSIKHLSPEIFKYQKFTIKSDVWAFGILLFEIFTDACEPYPGIPAAEVKKRLLESICFRTKIPMGMPTFIAKLMGKCWTENPWKRPTFKSLHKRLNRNYASLF